MSDLGGDGRVALAALRAAWGRDWDAAGAYLAVLLAAMGWEIGTITTHEDDMDIPELLRKHYERNPIVRAHLFELRAGNYPDLTTALAHLVGNLADENDRLVAAEVRRWQQGVPFPLVEGPAGSFTTLVRPPVAPIPSDAVAAADATDADAPAVVGP